MKKTIEHNGRTFILYLNLNAKVERKTDGCRWHKITAFEKIEESEHFIDDRLINSYTASKDIVAFETDLIFLVNNPIKSDEKMAIELGYTPMKQI